MQLTKNFNSEEFKCHCGCGSAEPSIGLLNILQFIRDSFNTSVTVVSGTRCHTHNTAVGGAKRSQHLIKDDGCSHAADIIVDGISPRQLYKFLDNTFPNTLGLGLYESWVHVDDRVATSFRWDKS
jgi:uncharacterized protein YcbK (DUF882 family)